MSDHKSSIIKSLSARLLGRYLSPKKIDKPISISEINSILILRNDAFGDAIVTTPLWRNLKRIKPSMTIGVVASPANIAFLQADPDIDQLFLLDDSVTDAQTITKIRQTRWDLTLCLKYNSKTKSALLARKLAPESITSTVAFNTDPKYDRLFSVVSRQDRTDGNHMTEVIRKQLDSVIDLRIQDWHPDIFIPVDVVESVSKTLAAAANFPSGFIHINLHASLPIREWGLQNVINFCRAFRRHHPELGVVITGDPKRIEADRTAIKAEGLPGVFVLPPLTQLELCAVVRLSRIVLTPDTSVTHIASAEHKPVVSLHYRKNEWYPYGVPYKIIYSHDEHSVEMIGVDTVLANVEALLAN